MTELKTPDLTGRICEVLPLEQSAALQALCNVLIALGERLTVDERASLASALPQDLRPHLSTRAPEMVVRPFVTTIAELQGMPGGRAAEYASSVCRVLGESLDRDALARLLRALPELEPLFAAVDSGEPPPHARDRNSLAEGRPGSAHPIATAAVPAGRFSY